MAEDSASLEARAYKQLYPDQYFTAFFKTGSRADGRSLGRGRPVNFAFGTLSTASSSAMVKIGRTAVLVGTRLSYSKPADDTPDKGSITFKVEFAGFSYVEDSRDRLAENIGALTARLQQALLQTNILDTRQLCVSAGKGCWNVLVEVYVLDNNGSVYDAALAAVVAAFMDLQLPPPEDKEDSAQQSDQPKQFVVSNIPVSLSCILYKDYLLADPTLDEESIAQTVVTVVLDQHGVCHGFYLSGGGAEVSSLRLRECIELASIRHKEVSELLQAALQPEDPME